MSFSGARQWRYECECLPEVADARHSQKWERMHSEVSSRNLEYFIDEGRVGDALDVEGLRWIYEEAGDSHVIVCNCCGIIKVVDG